MDIATIIGFATAFGLMIWAMSGSGNLGIFVDVPSLAIVVGGTIGTGFIHFPLKDMLGAMKIAKNAFFAKERDPKDLISLIVEYANKARKEGILALESAIQETDDEFLAEGLQLAVDGQEPAAIEAILINEIEQLKKRHEQGQDIFMALGSYAPAMGLIGTLIGLVQMLQNLSDPNSIGPAMAVALLTTFYGAILANVIFMPIRGKLERRSKKEQFMRELVLEGILSIAAGDNPRLVEQRLQAFFSMSERPQSEE